MRLPKKPSALLALAMEDFKKVEKSSKYYINMNDWARRWLKEGKCSVCLAGSVMMLSLRGEIRFTESFHAHPYSFLGNEKQLGALNLFRTGSIIEGFKELGYRSKKDLEFAKRLQERCLARATQDGFTVAEDDDFLPTDLYTTSTMVFHEYMARLIVSFKEGGY